MLIHRRVFNVVPRPWFEHRDLPDGTHEPSDTNFCRKLGEAGIPIYVDLETTMSHYNVVAVTPRYENGQWLTSFAIGHEECFQVTQTQQVPA